MPYIIRFRHPYTRENDGILFPPPPDTILSSSRRYSYPVNVFAAFDRCCRYYIPRRIYIHEHPLKRRSVGFGFLVVRLNYYGRRRSPLPVTVRFGNTRCRVQKRNVVNENAIGWLTAVTIVKKIVRSRSGYVNNG